MFADNLPSRVQSEHRHEFGSAEPLKVRRCPGRRTCRPNIPIACAFVASVSVLFFSPSWRRNSIAKKAAAGVTLSRTTHASECARAYAISESPRENRTQSFHADARTHARNRSNAPARARDSRQIQSRVRGMLTQNAPTHARSELHIVLCNTQGSQTSRVWVACNDCFFLHNPMSNYNTYFRS